MGRVTQVAHWITNMARGVISRTTDCKYQHMETLKKVAFKKRVRCRMSEPQKDKTLLIFR